MTTKELKLEVGKKYQDASGNIKGPLVEVSNGCFQFKGERWYPNGKYDGSKIRTPFDLIEEVILETSESEYIDLVDFKNVCKAILRKAQEK